MSNFKNLLRWILGIGYALSFFYFFPNSKVFAFLYLISSIYILPVTHNFIFSSLGVSLNRISRFGIFLGLTIVSSFFAPDNFLPKPDSKSEESISLEPKKLSKFQIDSLKKDSLLSIISSLQTTTIESKVLVNSYMNNEVKADNSFKGRSFYVTGYVREIGKDITGDIYVTLDSDDPIRSVQCFTDDKNFVLQIVKGQKVTFHGECDGLMMNVLMKNCKPTSNIEYYENELKHLKENMK